MYAIETKNLTKSYKKSRGIINIDLKIEKGEIFGFIGPNGAGKSTTIRTLLNFIFPDSGSASIMGLDCIKESKKIKQITGYLPSEINYYDNMKIKDLLLYSAAFYNKDCTKKINELTERFDVDTSKSIQSLSLGNKKKVGIIQALLHEPEILILDEPTSGLDPLMQKTFFDILKEENKIGTTIFFSSHILSEVQKLCSRVAIIKEGRILKIQDISKLTNAHFKRITIDSGSEINIPGMINKTYEGNLTKFMFNGEFDDLFKALSFIHINNIEIEEPSLEEIFMHYYEKENVQ